MVNKLNSIIVKIDRLSTFLFSRSGVSLCFEGKNLSEDIYYIYSRYTSWTPLNLIDQILFFPPLPFFSFVSSSLDVVSHHGNDVYMSFILAQSGQMMSSPSVMKPRPTNEVLQPAQMKQSLCQCLSSKEMKRVPPMPGNEFETGVSENWEPFRWKTNVRKGLRNDTCDRFGAGGASLGEQFSETIGAIGLVVARRESLASQGIVTVATGEAVSVPRLVLIRYPTAGDDLKTIKPVSIFVFISSFPSRERKFSSPIIDLKPLCIVRKGEGSRFVESSRSNFFSQRLYALTFDLK